MKLLLISLAIFVIASAKDGVNISPAETDWLLFAHGSARTRFVGTNDDWTSKYSGDLDFNFPIWMVPFGEGPNQAGGVNQRTSDGVIHIPLLGNVRYGGSPSWPAGGATRDFSPFYIWEINGDTGEHIALYDFSGETSLPRVDCPNSVVRYTSDGYPMFAGYTKGKRSVYILEPGNTKEVSFELDSTGHEPMLLQVTDTTPQQVVWAGLNGNSGFDVEGHKPNMETFFSTSAISTIIFGTDGKTLYNNQFFNGPSGLQIFDLPLTNQTKETAFWRGCYSRPWIMASDSDKNMYAICQSGAQKLVSVDVETGKTAWEIPSPSAPAFLVLTDNEKIILTGNERQWSGYSSSNGELLWTANAQDFGFGSCMLSAQPWAPRQPIPLNGGYLAALCFNDAENHVLVLDANTGEKVTDVKLSMTAKPAMMTADGNHNVYVYAIVDGKPVVERKSLNL